MPNIVIDARRMAVNHRKYKLFPFFLFSMSVSICGRQYDGNSNSSEDPDREILLHLEVLPYEGTLAEYDNGAEDSNEHEEDEVVAVNDENPVLSVDNGIVLFDPLLPLILYSLLLPRKQSSLS